MKILRKLNTTRMGTLGLFPSPPATGSAGPSPAMPTRLKGACLGLALLASMLASPPASAQVQLAEKDGWVFTFDGRINAFASTGVGDDFPVATLDPNGNTHSVMGGSAAPGAGSRTNVGWASNAQSDENHKYFAVRIRSGFYSNILGFGISKQVSERTKLRGYVSLWANIDTIGRDKWAPIIAEAREGFLDVEGDWGTLTVGRTLGWLGRMSYDIDRSYGHGYGLGLPCTDGAGPGCGHIGTGVLFPGYSAGIAYATPKVGGFTLHLGVYDPVVYSGNASDWSRAGMVRPEGSLNFDVTAGKVRFIAGIEGAYQTLSRIESVQDPTDPATMTQRTRSTSIWGLSGGGRVEMGPLRLGGSYFQGRGVGIGYALQTMTALEDNETSHPSGSMSPPPTFALRTFSGWYGQGAVVFGRLHLAGGFGRAWVDRLDADRVNPGLSVLRYQQGISAAMYFSLVDSVVLGLDYFNYSAFWWGAPQAEMGSATLTGARLRGERQTLNFVNLGVTFRW